MSLQTFTIADIRSWNPQYDPVWYLPEDWSGTAVDILRFQKIPVSYRIWIVCRENLIDAKTLRLFAVWCARKVLHLMTDQRLIAALDIAERFANGLATGQELAAALNAAREAENTALQETWEAWAYWAATVSYDAWDAFGIAASAAGAASAVVAALADSAVVAALDTAKSAPMNAKIEQLIKILEEGGG